MFALDGVLGALNVPELEVAKLRSLLEGYADDLGTDDLVRPVPGSTFGGSSAGGNLGHHTQLAQQVLAGALKDMVTGLRGQSESLREFTYDVGLRDEETTADMTALATATACISAPSAADSACALPPSATSQGSQGGGED